MLAKIQVASITALPTLSTALSALSADCCRSESRSKVALSNNSINFHLIAGQAIPVEANTPIRGIVETSLSKRVLNYRAAPLTCLGDEIEPEPVTGKVTLYQ